MRALIERIEALSEWPTSDSWSKRNQSVIAAQKRKTMSTLPPSRRKETAAGKLAKSRKLRRTKRL